MGVVEIGSLAVLVTSVALCAHAAHVRTNPMAGWGFASGLLLGVVAFTIFVLHAYAAGGGIGAIVLLVLLNVIMQPIFVSLFAVSLYNVYMGVSGRVGYPARGLRTDECPDRERRSLRWHDATLGLSGCLAFASFSYVCISPLLGA